VYSAGQQVVSPGNDVVSAKTTHTSGGSFTAANWNLSSTFAAFDSGYSLLAPGSSALWAYQNVVIGNGAMPLAAAGSQQVAIGYRALQAAADDGSGLRNGSNTAVGAYALQSSVSNQNTAVGSQAQQFNVGTVTTGISNCAFGDQALLRNVNGNSNNAFGVQALANTTVDGNTAFGHEALQQDTTGASNSAFGYLAGLSVTTGNLNTIIGNSAAYQGTGVVSALTTGSSNVFVGSGAGINSGTQPSNATAVGKGSLVGSSLATAIGAMATATASGSIAIGVDSGGTAAVAASTNLAVIGTDNHTVQVGKFAINSAATTTTAPGAGGAGALPATPAGYVTVIIAGTSRKIPYY
jgi:hypothetical protein